MQPTDLDRVTRNSLRTLPDGLAEIVALHLAAAAAVLPDNPELALAHTRAASRRAGRVAVVREAVGVAAYAAGDYATALTELRAAARISGATDYLPMMADCERGLGRPERALDLASSPDASTLDRDGKVELLIVAAGARRDLGQPEAAVLTLQVPALRARSGGYWLPRLRYAYADALLEVGRTDEARNWFVQAAEADPEGITDAVDRLDEFEGISFEEVEDPDAVVEEEVPAEAPANVEGVEGAEQPEAMVGPETEVARGDAAIPVEGSAEVEDPAAQPRADVGGQEVISRAPHFSNGDEH